LKNTNLAILIISGVGFLFLSGKGGFAYSTEFQEAEKSSAGSSAIGSRSSAEDSSNSPGSNSSGTSPNISEDVLFKNLNNLDRESRVPECADEEDCMERAILELNGTSEDFENQPSKK
jgi:hypothetical protein